MGSGVRYMVGRSFPKKLAFFVVLVAAVVGAVLWRTGSLPFFSAGSPNSNETAASAATASLKVLQTSPSTSLPTTSPVGPFEITFNQPIAKNTLSSLATSQPGSWKVIKSTTAVFTPAQPLMPDSDLTIKSSTGSSNHIFATNGDYLAKPINLSWKSAPGSVLRMQQILAKLGFLPLVWSPTTPSSSVSPVEELYNPPPGSFAPRYANTPTSLLASFQPGVSNNITKGAMVAFERSQGIAAYSSIRPLIWPALLSAEAAGVPNNNGYTYAMVSKTSPETITLWHDGKIVFSSLVNTGLAQTPTPNGTFYVYFRYPTQTMRGQNINGSYYVDHGVKWVNYIYGSVAIHGFIRASYGFPQSLGCIELPVSQAAIAWKWLHYGSVVNIS